MRCYYGDLKFSLCASSNIKWLNIIFLKFPIIVSRSANRNSVIRHAHHHVSLKQPITESRVLLTAKEVSVRDYVMEIINIVPQC